jgi:hypothetical protein
MILIQRRLKRVLHRGAWRGSQFLMGARALSVAHQAIALILVLPAAPDAPRDDEQASQHDGTANADDDANHGVLGLGGHAGGFAV